MPQQQTSEKIREKTTYKEPKKFVVIMFDDDVTTMDFVVMVLETVFHKQKDEAEKLMLTVHNEGQAKIGTYSYDMARTKVNRATTMAQDKGFPLKLVFQPE